MLLSHQPVMSLIVEVFWIQLFSSFFTMWIECSINCSAVVTLGWCIWHSASHQQPGRDHMAAAAFPVKGSCKPWTPSSLSHCTHFTVGTLHNLNSANQKQLSSWGFEGVLTRCVECCFHRTGVYLCVECMDIWTWQFPFWNNKDECW